MAASVAELTNELSTLRGQLFELDAELKQKNDLIAQLKDALHAALHRQFGTSSEQIPAEQARLFDEADAHDTQDANDAPSSEDIAVAGHTRRRRGRVALPEDLPRVEVIHDLEDHEKVCTEHGCALDPMGEVISEQLEFIPASVLVRRHIQRKYTCPHCTGGVVTAKKPPQPIPKSIATPSLLAWIIVSKYADALPLYRQTTIFERLGIDLDRTTLANWMMACGELVQPLINLLAERQRASPLLHMDETTVQVLAEPGRAPSAKSYMWITASGPPDAGTMLFHYAPSRSAATAQGLIGDFAGALMVDGYEGYQPVCDAANLTRLGCWAHARRRFVEAKRTQPKGKTGAADQGLAWIGKLYLLERQNAEATPEARHTARQSYALPILEQLRTWLDKQLPRTAPKTALGKALHYLDSQWSRLIRYTEDGIYPIDNNRAENAVRPFVVGRKNWLFSQSQSGCRASANLYSLIETAKAHDIEPMQYLLHILERLPSAQSVDDIEALLPHNVKDAV